MNLTRTLPSRTGLARTSVVMAFGLTCAGLFGWMWAESGGTIPGVTSPPPYTVSFSDSDVLNLVTASSVQTAGVPVGQVKAIAPKPGGATIVIGVNSGSVPLHRGVKVRVGIRSLEGPSYVDVIDGHGPALPSGTVLPASAVQPTVDVHALLASLNAPTRAKLGSLIRSLGSATKGTSPDVSQLMTALGTIGGQGYTAVDAIAAQSAQLQQLSGDTATLLNALDTGQGQIASVVRDAQRITTATSGQSDAVAATVRELPGVLSSTDTAATKVTQLTGSLSPVTSGLRAAAPGLNQALMQLPQTTSDLRSLDAPLDATLRRAPATLNRVPAAGSDLDTFLPATHDELRDIDPMLSYASPYGREIGAFFANFGDAISYQDENGDNYMRLMPFFNERSLKGYPVNLTKTLPMAPLMQENPYPAPGTEGGPQPFSGTAPHVTRKGS